MQHIPSLFLTSLQESRGGWDKDLLFTHMATMLLVVILFILFFSFYVGLCIY